MKIENNKLIINEPITEDNLEEFKVALSQPQIEEIVIEHVDLIAPAIQILWCLNKKISTSNELLQKLFENCKGES